MLRLNFLCLALGLAACASAPPGLDLRPENPALATAPESSAPRYRTALNAKDPAEMPQPAVEDSAASEPGMSPEGGMAGMDHAAGGRPPADAPLYACPMHPEKHYREPGKCPICGMILEPVEPEKEGHP